MINDIDDIRLAAGIPGQFEVFKNETFIGTVLFNNGTIEAELEATGDVWCDYESVESAIYHLASMAP